jgi:hypothetical protein
LLNFKTQVQTKQARAQAWGSGFLFLQAGPKALSSPPSGRAWPGLFWLGLAWPGASSPSRHITKANVETATDVNQSPSLLLLLNIVCIPDNVQARSGNCQSPTGASNTRDPGMHTQQHAATSHALMPPKLTECHGMTPAPSQIDTHPSTCVPLPSERDVEPGLHRWSIRSNATSPLHHPA